MTASEIKSHIRIVVTPEPAETPHGRKFWLHTHGMTRFSRPELEFRNVPALFVCEAGRLLNGWAALSVDDEILPGEPLIQKGTVEVLLRAVTTASPEFWGETPVLWLRPEAACCACDACKKQNRKGRVVEQLRQLN